MRNQTLIKWHWQRSQHHHKALASVIVTHSSQQTLGLLNSTIASKETNKHHHWTDTNQDVDTWTDRQENVMDIYVNSHGNTKHCSHPPTPENWKALKKLLFKIVWKSRAQYHQWPAGGSILLSSQHMKVTHLPVMPTGSCFQFFFRADCFMLSTDFPFQTQNGSCAWFLFPQAQCLHRLRLLTLRWRLMIILTASHSCCLKNVWRQTLFLSIESSWSNKNNSGTEYCLTITTLLSLNKCAHLFDIFYE